MTEIPNLRIQIRTMKFQSLNLVLAALLILMTGCAGVHELTVHDLAVHYPLPTHAKVASTNSFNQHARNPVNSQRATSACSRTVSVHGDQAPPTKRQVATEEYVAKPKTVKEVVPVTAILDVINEEKSPAKKPNVPKTLNRSSHSSYRAVQLRRPGRVQFFIRNRSAKLPHGPVVSNGTSELALSKPARENNTEPEEDPAMLRRSGTLPTQISAIEMFTDTAQECLSSHAAFSSYNEDSTQKNSPVAATKAARHGTKLDERNSSRRYSR